MAIKLASLFIKLGADTAEISTAFDKTRKGSRKWEKDLKKAGAGVGKTLRNTSILAAGVGTAFAVMFKSTASSIDELAKTSAKLGTTTDGLQAVQFAGEKAGLALTTVNTGLQRQTRRLAEAAQGLGEAKDAIKDLGLDAQALSKLNPEVALTRILDELNKIPAQSDRVRLAFKIFDTEGVGFLNLTSEAIVQARKDLDSMGVTLSQLDASKVEQANDAVSNLSLITKGMKTRLTVNMADPLKLIADQLFEGAKQGQQFDVVAKQLVRTGLVGISSLSSSGAGFLQFIDKNETLAQYGLIGLLFRGKKGLAAGVGAGAFVQMGKDAKQTFDEVFNPETVKKIDQLEFKLGRLRGVLKSPRVGSRSAIKQAIADTEAEIAALKKNSTETAGIVDSMANSLQSIHDATQLAIKDFDNGVTNIAANAGNLIEPLDVLTGGAKEATTEIDDAEKVLFDNRLERLHNFKEAIENADITYPSPLPPPTEEEENPFKHLLFNAKEFEDKWTAYRQLGAKHRAQILFLETTGSLAILGQHSRKFFELNKAAGIGNAVVNVAEGISAALKLGWPVGVAAATKVALVGAAQISQIKNTKFGSGSAPSASDSGGVSAPNPTFATAGPGVTDNDVVDQPQTVQATPTFNFTVIADHQLTDRSRFAELAIDAFKESVEDKSLLLTLNDEEIAAQLNIA